MQVCISLLTDNDASTPPLSVLQSRMPFLPPNQQRHGTEGSYLTVRFKGFLGFSKIRLLYSGLRNIFATARRPLQVLST